MNTLSFELNAEYPEHIYIDGIPLVGSRWMNWDELVDCMEKSGRWQILTCSCGIAECGGTKDYLTLCCGNLVVWRTYDPWQGSVYCFDRVQSCRIVYDALKELEWLHFFHSENEDSCPCSPENSAHKLRGWICEAKRVFDASTSAINISASNLLSEKLLTAICLGDTDGLQKALLAGADPNHETLFWDFSEYVKRSVLQNALTFAPASVRLKAVKLLVEYGADVNCAIQDDVSDWSHVIYDVIDTYDVEIINYLYPLLDKTEANRKILEKALKFAASDYQSNFYRYIQQQEDWGSPRYSFLDNEKLTLERIDAYRHEARILNFPLPDHLQATKEYLEGMIAT